MVGWVVVFGTERAAGVGNGVRNLMIALEKKTDIYSLVIQKKVHQQNCQDITPWQTNITMENGPFEDVFPIENRYIIFHCYVSLPEGIIFFF